MPITELNITVKSINEGQKRFYYLALNKPSYKMPLSGYIKTTSDKTEKTIRIEPYIKTQPIIKITGRLWSIISGGDSDRPDLESDEGIKNFHVTLSNLIDSDITFESATFFYSPSSIQNIVGGGEVHYLAIEQ